MSKLRGPPAAGAAPGSGLEEQRVEGVGAEPSAPTACAGGNECRCLQRREATLGAFKHSGVQH